jgi:protein TonB
MSATINTFPPLQQMNTPRGWALGLIVLVHAGFFYALTSGMALKLLPPRTIPTQVIPIDPKALEPPKPTQLRDPDIDRRVWVQKTNEPPLPPTDQDTSLTDRRTDLPPPRPEVFERTQPVREATMVQPGADPRNPFSEPQYPSAEIRQGHEGTVLLSIQVLENGRVGDVRVEQSSGFPALDQSAMREAKRWRFRPGTRDGLPVSMWKQVPIKFELKE